MQGTVKGLSSNQQRAAVLTDDGFTVFDIEDGEVAMGDRLSGCLDEHGSTVLSNRTSGHKVDVYIEAIQATPEFAQTLLDQASHR